MGCGWSVSMSVKLVMNDASLSLTHMRAWPFARCLLRTSMLTKPGINAPEKLAYLVRV